ncbi:MAG TPA: hypothetical protein VET27_03375 [Mycobacterium sp.]|nr:hypothetical protein [Mycobacterium sp.]
MATFHLPEVGTDPLAEFHTGLEQLLDCVEVKGRMAAEQGLSDVALGGS